MIYKKFFCSLPLTAFIITIVFLTPVIAQGTYLRWNANHEADLAGYRAYYGTSSAQYDRTVNLGMVTRLNLSNLNLQENVPYYISITAYDSAGNESGLSTELHLSLDEEISDYFDNCPDIYNPDQEDTYPPGGNDRGDNCDCEGDFSCDGDVDGIDSMIFLTDFGRNAYHNPCPDCVAGDWCSG